MEKHLRLFVCFSLLAGATMASAAPPPQATPHGASTSSSHPAVAPHLICATCGDGGGDVANHLTPFGACYEMDPAWLMSAMGRERKLDLT